MENDNIYQVFQESFNKQINSPKMDFTGGHLPPTPNGYQPPQQHPPLPPQHEFQHNNVWPQNAYAGAELDFPTTSSEVAASMFSNTVASSRQQSNFYGQEFYDIQSQQQPPSMQNFQYDVNSGGGMMMPPQQQQPPSYPPAGVSPSPQWPQPHQYSVATPPVLTKNEPPPTPQPPPEAVGFQFSAEAPVVDPFDTAFAIQEQPSSTASDSQTLSVSSGRGGRGRGSMGKGGLKASGGVNKRRKGGSGDGPDNVAPEVRQMKEKERRVSNNTRERIRIRDINEALTELGRVVMTLRPKAADKPQTKLAVLNMAVDVITHLEKKVRERNLNPAALALNRGPGGQFPASSSASSSSVSASAPTTATVASPDYHLNSSSSAAVASGDQHPMHQGR